MDETLPQPATIAPPAAVPVAAPERPSRGWIPYVLAGALIAAYFITVLQFTEPAITTPDANGYWAQAALLKNTGQTWFKSDSDLQYIGMHWLLNTDGRYFSRYPPGVPVLIAAAMTIGGTDAATWFDPLLATLTLAGFFLLCRHFLSAWLSLAATLLLALNPAFTQHALFHYAHMAVAVLLVWGLWFLIRWSRSGRAYNLFFAALLLGGVPAMRYPEVVFGIGCAVFVLWELFTNPHFTGGKRWLNLALAVVGVSVPLVPLMLYHQRSFGSMTTTAYVLTNEQTGFGWDYFTQHFGPYIRSLHSDGAGMLFPLGLLGLGAMCLSSTTRRVGVMLILIVVPSTLLYMAYYWGMGLNNGGGMGGPGGVGGGNIRYLVPTLPCYIFAGVWFLSTALKDQKKLLFSSLALLTLFQVFWGDLALPGDLRQTQHQKHVLALTAEHLTKVAQPNDIVIADQQVLQDLDFLQRWRLADSSLVQGRARGRGRFGNDRDPDQPSPMQTKKLEQFEAKYGSMNADEREIALADELMRWAGKSKVYFVGPESELENLGQGDFDKTWFKIIERIELPPAPESNRMNPFGGPPGGGGFGGRRGGRGGGGGNWRGGGGPGGGPNWGGNNPPPPQPGGPGNGGNGPQGPGPGGPGGWGGGMRFRIDEKEFVIAEWIPPDPESKPESKK